MAFVGEMTTLKIEFQQKCFFISRTRKAKENSKKKIKDQKSERKGEINKVRDGGRMQNVSPFTGFEPTREYSSGTRRSPSACLQ